METNEGLKTEMETRKEELKQEGRMIGQEARQAAQSFMKDASHWTASALHDLSDVIRASAHEMEQRRHNRATPVMMAAADKIDRASHTFETGDFQTAFNRAKQFARERPGLFVGATALAGIAIGRFLRNSSRGYERRRMRREEWRTRKEQESYTGGAPTSESFPGQPSGGTYTGA